MCQTRCWAHSLVLICQVVTVMPRRVFQSLLMGNQQHKYLKELSERGDCSVTECHQTIELVSRAEVFALRSLNVRLVGFLGCFSIISLTTWVGKSSLILCLGTISRGTEVSCVGAGRHLVLDLLPDLGVFLQILLHQLERGLQRECSIPDPAGTHS